MIGLNLRDEFRGKHLKGTAIELANGTNTGATQVGAQAFLDITYPTRDILKAIDAVGPNHGRPVVVIGERGLGKSHVLATMFHAVSDPTSTKAWLNAWATTLNEPAIAQIPLRDGMFVIGESLQKQRIKHLWDLLFARHPHGAYIKGKWEAPGAAKTNVPSDELIIELLQHTPTMLLLDEYQTWYDGLTDTRQAPAKTWAFNFIQILSEIAEKHPDLLALVVSVRNGSTDAYQQIHRVNPVQVDFKAGGTPERIQLDRRRMLLHRLFENRLQVAEASITQLIEPHVKECYRLLDIPSSEQERRTRDFKECWPFSPYLLQLLEDQVLVATDAQETRDLIRILANLFKAQGERSTILTAADFRLDNDATGIGALLDSVANKHHQALRDIAQRNILSVTDAVQNSSETIPHLQELVGALWLRSIAVGNQAGADAATLQLDITRSKAIDDNGFQVELAAVVENSFNIHQDGHKLVFREEENPQAKLLACARNDKLFHDASDLIQLAKQVRYVIGGSEEIARTFRVIALPHTWASDPWKALDETEQPDRWDDRLPILVLPEDPDNLHARLGRWLKDHLQKRRNTVRFLVPRAGSTNAFLDRDLLILARAELKAQEWTSQNPEYKKLQGKYQTELRDILKKRFDRFAVLHQWNNQDPAQCTFHVESLKAQGAQIPDAIEKSVTEDLFVPEDFTDLVLEIASNSESVGKLLRELQEPRPGGLDCIPWLGEPAVKERILRICAKGKIAINLRSLEYLQAHPGEAEEDAWRRMRPKLSLTGRQLDEVFLLQPSAVPTTGGTTPTYSGKGEMPVGGLFGGGPTGVTPPSSGGAVGGTEPVVGQGAAGGDIFGNGGSSPTATPRTRFTNPATSPLNLIGKLEGWGIGPATPVAEVTLKLNAATGAQIKDLLKKLPDGLTFELSLEKEDR